jgi:hypothetical protein
VKLFYPLLRNLTLKGSSNLRVAAQPLALLRNQYLGTLRSILCCATFVAEGNLFDKQTCCSLRGCCLTAAGPARATQQWNAKLLVAFGNLLRASALRVASQPGIAAQPGGTYTPAARLHTELIFKLFHDLTYQLDLEIPRRFP